MTRAMTMKTIVTLKPIRLWFVSLLGKRKEPSMMR